MAFPGNGRRGVRQLAELQRIAELERKIGQLTMENDFLKRALEHLRANQPPALASGAVLIFEDITKQAMLQRQLVTAGADKAARPRK